MIEEARVVQLGFSMERPSTVAFCSQALDQGFPSSETGNR